MVVANLGMQVIGHPIVRRGEEPFPSVRRAVLVGPDAVDAVIGPDVQLVRMEEVIVEEPLDGTVVPELGGSAGDQIESIDLQGAARGQPHSIELARVPVRIPPVPDSVVVAEVPDEDLARRSAFDLADAGIGGCAVDRAASVSPSDVRVAVLRRVAREMQPVARVESAERALARLHEVQRRMRRQPEVLRLVGGGADDRLLEDSLCGAIAGVRAAPRARTSKAGSRADAELRGAATRCHQQRNGGRPPHGRTLITAAPPCVATSSAGGSTMVSSWMRSTRSLGMSFPARIDVFAPVTGSQITSPL